MALIKEYFELSKKYQNDYGENIILLMQVGSFFEVYGIHDKITDTITESKIVEFSQFCELNIVEKNVSIGKNKVVMAGFKDIMIEKYIKKIQEAGYTSVVYTQDAAEKNTTRSLAGIFSPGTYFSSDSKKLTNNITCIWIQLIENNFLMKGKFVIVGISNIDIYTGKTSIFQFKETYINNPTTYDELERFISINKPSEVIIISNLPDKEVDDIINYTNINSVSIHKINFEETNRLDNPYIPDNIFVKRAKNCENQIYQKEILNKFYKIDDFDIFIQNFYENNIATQSFCFLLDFVYQHNSNLVLKISEPIFENCSDRLILANHSLKQLNIIDDTYNGKYSSVVKILNICLTPMGKRKFEYKILNPTTNEKYLQNEYDITEHALNNYAKYNEFIKQKLLYMKDISKFERQLFLKKISPKSFYQLYNNILLIKDVFDFIIQDDIIKKYLLVFEKNTLDIGKYCENIISFITNYLNLESSKEIDQINNFEINFINIGIDDQLDEKNRILFESESKLESIKNYFNSLIESKENKKIKTEYVKINETEKNNNSLITTSRRCKILEDSLPSITSYVKLSFNNSAKNEFDFKIGKKQFEYCKQTSSNNSINDEQIKSLCKSITSTKNILKELITLVFNKFIEKFIDFQKELESIIHFITLIDIIYAKSNIAKKYNYCKPTICSADKSFINAKKIRHCLIEHIQTNELYVTNDISIGDKNIDGILLYGTNAVGKTSLIRALGISLIMAQSGLYVPCSEFNFKPYKYLFTRIIGNDNIFKGLSTFAVEMSELRTILRLADENSLILGDELCSGTENTSAISIFVAGIQKLYSFKSSFIFATHLHEIVNYDEITELKTVVLRHMSVVYDKEKDELVYDRKLKDGPGNNMYGLEVCKSLKLPEDFLDAAYNIRIKYNSEFGSILSLKTSHFNSKKIVNICEICKTNMGSEVHHLQYQKNANENGIINMEENVFHKNALANLVTICNNCHNTIHEKNIKHKKVKTSNGYRLKEIECK